MKSAQMFIPLNVQMMLHTNTYQELSGEHNLNWSQNMMPEVSQIVSSMNKPMDGEFRQVF
jgi:hypothetical protein